MTEFSALGMVAVLLVQPPPSPGSNYEPSQRPGTKLQDLHEPMVTLTLQFCPPPNLHPSKKHQYQKA